MVSWDQGCHKSKTSKTMFLPWFYKVECGSGSCCSCGEPPCYGGLTQRKISADLGGAPGYTLMFVFLCYGLSASRLWYTHLGYATLEFINFFRNECKSDLNILIANYDQNFPNVDFYLWHNCLITLTYISG